MGLDFGGADLSHAVFSGSWCNGVKLMNAKPGGTRIMGSSLLGG